MELVKFPDGDLIHTHTPTHTELLPGPNDYWRTADYTMRSHDYDTPQATYASRTNDISLDSIS